MSKRLSVAIDLPAEVAEHLARALEDQPSGNRIVPSYHRRLWVGNEDVGASVRADCLRRVYDRLCHLKSSLATHFPSAGGPLQGAA